MNKIIVSWSNGFLWFHFSKYLLNAWNEIIWLHRPILKNVNKDLTLMREKILQNFASYQCVTVDKFSISNINEIVKNSLVDVFIHVAGNANVRDFVDNPASNINKEIELFSNVIEWCRQGWVKKFIYTSSTFTSFADDENKGIVNPYSATNKSKEVVARSYDTYYNMKTIWLRLPGIYWPYSRDDTIINVFVSKLLNNGVADIYWDPNSKIPLIDVWSLCDWFGTILNSNLELSWVYSIKPINAVSINDIISIIHQVTGRHLLTKYCPISNLYSVHPTLHIQNDRYSIVELENNIKCSLIETIEWLFHNKKA